MNHHAPFEHADALEAPDAVGKMRTTHALFVRSWLDCRVGSVDGEERSDADVDRGFGGRALKGVEASRRSSSASPQSSDHVARLLLVALRAIWSRSRSSLGEVTLGALFARVFEGADRTHPILRRSAVRLAAIASPQRLSSLPSSKSVAVAEMEDMDMNIIDLDVGLIRAGSKHEHDIASELLIAAQALLAELLSVLGRLTAETLTPGIRQELDAITVMTTTAEGADRSRTNRNDKP